MSKAHSALPVLTEVVPDTTFTLRYGGRPGLTLHWEEDIATWQVLDTGGRPFRGATRLALLTHCAAAFHAQFSPRVRASLARAIARGEEARLLTRDAVQGVA